MVITNLQEKQNRKIWVPIRGGNRGGWSLFEWQKVRQMPYRDREMYLGNSAMIGVLDKGGKWRKKDWYLHKNDLESGQTLNSQMTQAMRRDQMRMKAALGQNDSDEQEQKLSPAQMQELLKKVRGNKQEGVKIESQASGLGFDKAKVQIRARPNAKAENPHRLSGNFDEFQEKVQRNERKRENLQKHQRSRSRDKEQKRHKKHKKEKKEKKHKRQHSRSQERHHKKHRHHSEQRQRSRDQWERKKHKEHKQKKHKRDREER